MNFICTKATANYYCHDALGTDERENKNKKYKYNNNNSEFANKQLTKKI